MKTHEKKQTEAKQLKTEYNWKHKQKPELKQTIQIH